MVFSPLAGNDQQLDGSVSDVVWSQSPVGARLGKKEQKFRILALAGMTEHKSRRRRDGDKLLGRAVEAGFGCQ